jgi:probable HAF family extracellular repeat protein
MTLRRNTIGPGLAVLAASLLTTLAPPAESGGRKLMEILPLPGGTRTTANAINNAGVVVGDGDKADGYNHGLTWVKGKTTELPGAPPYTSTHIGGVGDPARAVGYSYGEDNLTQAFVSNKGKVTALRPLPGGVNTYATAVNNKGWIAGTGETPMITFHATLWKKPGKPVDLGTLGGENSEALGVTPANLGWVVGSAETETLERHATLWRNGKPRDLGTLPGGSTSIAWEVSSKKLIVGQSDNAKGNTRPVYWDAKLKIHGLGLPDGFTQGVATSINNSGLAAGLIVDADGAFHAAVFDIKKKTATDLNRLAPAGSGWTLIRATGINDAWQVVGQGMRNGNVRGFVFNLK